MHRSIAMTIAGAASRRRMIPSPSSVLVVNARPSPPRQHSFALLLLLRASSSSSSTSSMTASSSSVIDERRRRPPQRRGGRKKANGNVDASPPPSSSSSSAPNGSSPSGGVRFSALLSRHLGLSRRQAERMMLTERVTLFGKVANIPSFGLRPSTDPNQHSGTAVKVDGKLVMGIDDTLRAMHAEIIRASFSSSTSSNITGVIRGGGGGGGADGGPAPVEDDDGPSSPTNNTRVWLANKLGGELVTEDDPVGRPSMLQRLVRGGVGKGKTGSRRPPVHLKPVGRLDMMTEGLMVFTNDGNYARELELPGNKCWRTYRARVHGRLTPGKMRAMRDGLTVRVDDNENSNDGPGGGAKKGKDENPGGNEVVRTGKLMRYKGIKVSIESRNLPTSRGASSSSPGGGGRGRGTNTWLRITCTEGKNRQLRRILSSMGLDVTRLIRISYGDYDLNTIPPGMAIEVRCKALDEMKSRGPLFAAGGGDRKKRERGAVEDGEGSSKVEWINYS